MRNRLQLWLGLESLESRRMLTRMLALAEPEVLVEPDEGYVVSAYAMADLNADDADELVVLQSLETGTETGSPATRVVIFSRNTPGPYRRVGVWEHDVSSAAELVLKDANGDGIHEIALRGASGLTIAEITFDDVTAQISGLRSFAIQNLSLPEDLALKSFDIADLNADGQIDLLVLGGGGTFVLLADMDGVVSNPIRYEGEARLADFNGDDFPDLLAHAVLTDTVLLNDGSGAFEASSIFPSGPSWDSVALDWDLDGNTDIVREVIGIEFLRGNGDGTFAEPTLLLQQTPLTENAGYQKLAVVDFDGDGRDDLFVGTESDVHSGVVPPRILFYTELGTDTFQFPFGWQVWDRDRFTTIDRWKMADTDGDGRGDFIMQGTALEVVRQIDPRSLEAQTITRPNLARTLARLGNELPVHAVFVMEDRISIIDLSSQDRTEREIELGLNLNLVHTIDEVQRADGMSEIILVADAEEGSVFVSVRDTLDDWFVQSIPIPQSVLGCLGINLCAIVQEDFDLDGFTDLALVSGQESRSLIVLANDHDGWREPQTVSSFTLEEPFQAGLWSYSLEIEDVDGNGLPDILFQTNNNFSSRNLVATALNQGDEGWIVTETVVLPEPLWASQRFDMNGDGLLDFIGEREINLLMPTGEWVVWDAPRPLFRPDFLDLNGDGLLDIIEGGDIEPWIHLNQGDGNWETSRGPEFSQLMATLELTGDGAQDMVFFIRRSEFARSGDNFIQWYDEEGWSIRPMEEVKLRFRPHVWSHDLDGDGNTDLVFLPDTEQASGVAYLHDGAGQLATFDLGELYYRILAWDVNGDGIDEILADTNADRTAGWKILHWVGDEFVVIGEVQLMGDSLDFHERQQSDIDGDGIDDLSFWISRSETNAVFTAFFGSPDFAVGEMEILPGGGATSGDGLLLDLSPIRRVGDAVSVSALTRTNGLLDWETIMLGLQPEAGIEYVDVDENGQLDLLLVSELGATIVLRQRVGDFDGDNSIDANDLDDLFAADPADTDQFDLNHDLRVDNLDVDFWLQHAANTRRGDTNFDGRVAFDDFLALSANYGQTNAAWSQGDFSGDRAVDFEDFLILAANFGFERTA